MVSFITTKISELSASCEYSFSLHPFSSFTQNFKALEKMGVDLQSIDEDTPFPTLYEVDVTTMPKAIVSAVGAVVGSDVFAGSVRTLIGLAFGSAENLGCGRSWVVPGADHLYANVL